MGKNTQSATLSNLDAVAVAMDARQEHFRIQIKGFDTSIASLKTQQSALLKSFDQMNTANVSFQNTMSSQFAAFQLLVLDELHLLKSANPPPPHPSQPTTAPPTPTLTPVITRLSTPIPTPSLYSLFAPPPTAYSGLGLSNPPSPSVAHIPPIYLLPTPFHHPPPSTVT
ncbi:hypothetical protein EV2_030502 [Malus domestica]